MKTTPGMTAIWLALLLAPAMGQAQDAGAPVVITPGRWDGVEGSAPAAPAEAPPPPAAAIPAPPSQAGQQPGAPAGQWVDTQQYGRVWMPYADAYTYAPANGYGEPYQYVYYPSYGWTWVVAPWIWGWGPWPTFGLYGPAYFGWYAHGWWRTPARWHYVPSYRAGAASPGFRPSPFHGGAPGGRVAVQPGFRAPGHAPGGFAVRPAGAPGRVGWSPGGGGHASVRPSGGHSGGHRR